MTPQYGTPVVVGYGNGASTNGTLPAITNTLAQGTTGRMSPPSLTNAPRMPFVERATPRSVTATRVIPERIAQARTRVTTAAKRATGRAAGYVRAARMRYFQDIGTPLRSDQ